MDGRGSYEEVPGGDDAGPCAPRASRRGRLAVVGGLLSAAALASLGLGSSSWLARGQTASSQLSSVSTYKFTYKDFVKEDDIKAYLEMIGVDTDDSEEIMDEGNTGATTRSGGCRCDELCDGR